ncbi:MAG: hypothetical protein HXY41_11830 [Chloroflexi bacterium]|nr:hypothetical protein [Chloroflexota bacterium]
MSQKYTAFASLRLLLILVLLSLRIFNVSAQTQPGAVPYELGIGQIIDPYLDDLAIPVMLQGAIALPDSTTPAPLVVILHGRHAMCGVDISTYPCEPGTEIRYDLGFIYLLEALARQGYAAMAININAALTEAYGRGDADARAAQLMDLHLSALRDAAAGRDSGFPLALEGRINFEQMALIGHSSGGGAALHITRQRANGGEAEDIDALLLVAAAYNALGPEGIERTGEELYVYYSVPSDVPVATVLPDCDGDQIRFWSQIAYEAARLDPQRTAFAASVRVFAANHNHFNTNVERGDRRFGYPPCFGETTNIMPRSDQETFLAGYTADFLATAWGDAPASAAFDAASPAPAALYGAAIQTNLSLPAAQRQVVVFPQTADERDTNRLGGALTLSGDAGVMFCPPGENCLAGITTAGRFGYLRLSWAGRSVFAFALPPGAGDLSAHNFLHMRIVPDYTSTLNAAGSRLNFVVKLRDEEGSESAFIVENESILDLPLPAEYYAYQPFVLFPASVRIPLAAFTGIDLTRVSDLIVQGQESSGALLLADLELLKAE